MLNLITDRTEADVERWRMLHDKGWEAMTASEQAEWVGGMKGAYKHTDMNRVESAVQELAGRLAERGTVLSLSTKTNWARSGRPTASDMDRYYRNVAAIRSAIQVDLNTPRVPTIASRFDYEQANNIEKILLAVDKWLDQDDGFKMYSGDIYLGEV